MAIKIFLHIYLIFLSSHALSVELTHLSLEVGETIQLEELDSVSWSLSRRGVVEVLLNGQKKWHLVGMKKGQVIARAYSSGSDLVGQYVVNVEKTGDEIIKNRIAFFLIRIHVLLLVLIAQSLIIQFLGNLKIFDCIRN